jgi:hypothetical protein
MLARPNNLSGIAKNAGAFYQKLTKILSLKASEVEIADYTFYEKPEVHKSHLLQVELRRAQVISEFQRQSLR